MFESLLIANRGEIACRIIKTARKMGLRTIAVFSEADRDALHVRMADEAVAIGPAPARESYLCTDKILDAARLTGAQAIHPGYGFLSEQTDLVKGCAAQGIVWVGPHMNAIASMGSKIAAKKIAVEAGVPCIPGYSGEDQSDAALVAAAHEVGLPVMVKASAGGGGKGMRTVFELIDLEPAIKAARAEAARSFGDGRLLIEKLVQNPRHVEVQLLGDKHGNLIHLFERDCSVQRNHQKILEEAPAPNLTEATRAALFDAALELGRKIGYDSTGTIEFVLDAATEEFFFLEMNTRLQVEHTATEEVTGLDLVEQQLWVAAGEPLSLSQGQVTCTGHSIEARLTAEDASDGFRPKTGTILRWRVSKEIRCDSGVETGSVVGSNYDSMIAKLISHGTDRDAALRKLISGLERTEIAGPGTNRQFLRDALRTRRFQSGEFTTDFLAQEWREGWQPKQVNTLLYAVLAYHLDRAESLSPWQSLGGFRLLEAAGRPAHAVYLDTETPADRISVRRETENRFVVSSTSGEEVLTANRLKCGPLRVERNGVQEIIGSLISGSAVHVWGKNFDATHQIVQLGDYNAAQKSNTTAAPDQIAATMPGLVLNVLAEQGALVEAGDTLVVMESMKLLMELKAPAAGTVKNIKAAPGESVEAGALLVQLELSEELEG